MADFPRALSRAAGAAWCLLACAAAAAVLFLVCGSAAAVEFEEPFEGPCSPDPCGCSGGCGRTGETPYGFDGSYFRTHETPEPYWTRSVHEAGTGVGGSDCFRAVSESVADMSQSSCYFEIGFPPDGDLFVRGCWRFDDAWDNHSLVDQKLYYLYFAVEEVGYGPNVTLFWHAGSSESGWGGDGMELALYSIPGDWCHANSASNEVRHENRLKLAEHIGEWICIEVHEDLDESTWVRTAWVTTETGAARLEAGTAGLVEGTMQFNDYAYARQTVAGVPQTLVDLKFGQFGLLLPLRSFLQTYPPSIRDLCSFPASDSKMQACS